MSDVTVTKYTIKEACEIIGVELPKKYMEKKDVLLSNITIDVNSLMNGGGFLLAGKNKEEREKALNGALNKNVKVYFMVRQAVI